MPPSSGDAEMRPAKRNKLRKEEIIAEATRLFAERGYEGTSMGDLAERVGLRKASLFHHFESKDVLYTTVVSQLVRGVQAALVGAAAAEGSYACRLDALTDAITGILGQEPYAARLLVREAMDWGPMMREQLAIGVQGVLRAAVDFIKAGQREGVFNHDLDADHLIVSLIGLYFIPFVIDRTVERFAGQSPFESPFIDDRRRAVRDQIRTLVLVAANE
jgi:AcrR family transcriptional regulator